MTATTTTTVDTAAGTATVDGRGPATSDAGGTVGIRLRLSALWTTMLFVFVYVDLFSFFRPDVRAEIAAGEIAGFAIGEGFLLMTTAYVLIPSLMIFLSLVLPRRVARPVTIALAIVYSATIVGGAVGEWGYYVLGSVVEVALLVTMIVLARRWTTG